MGRGAVDHKADVGDVRLMRLQQLLRFVRAGVRPVARRASRRRAVEQRRMRHRAVERSEGARNKDGRTFFPSAGYSRRTRCGGVLGELRVVRRYVETGYEPARKIGARDRDILYRRSVSRFRRFGDGESAGNGIGTVAEGIAVYGNTSKHRHRSDEDARQDSVETLQAVSETRRLLLYAPTAGYREGFAQIPRRGCMGRRAQMGADARGAGHRHGVGVRATARAMGAQPYECRRAEDVERVARRAMHRIRADALAEEADRHDAVVRQRHRRLRGVAQAHRAVCGGVCGEVAGAERRLFGNNGFHPYEPVQGECAAALRKPNTETLRADGRYARIGEAFGADTERDIPQRMRLQARRGDTVGPPPERRDTMLAVRHGGQREARRADEVGGYAERTLRQAQGVGRGGGLRALQDEPKPSIEKVHYRLERDY